MNASYTLYAYWRSSSSYRVRIGLEWKGVPFRVQPVHLLEGGGEQKRESYRRLNPMAQVPTLVVEQGDRTQLLGQSLAILEYLEEQHPTPPLLPRDPFLRARARQLAEIVNSGIQPFQNLAALDKVKALGGEPKAWAAGWIAAGLAAMEELAPATAGRFLVGDAPTIADACLVPQLYGARRFGVDLAPYKTLLQIEEACAALEPFQRAHPDRQPDAQPSP